MRTMTAISAQSLFLSAAGLLSGCASVAITGKDARLPPETQAAWISVSLATHKVTTYTAEDQDIYFNSFGDIPSKLSVCQGKPGQYVDLGSGIHSDVILREKRDCEGKPAILISLVAFGYNLSYSGGSSAGTTSAVVAAGTGSGGGSYTQGNIYQTQTVSHGSVSAVPSNDYTAMIKVYDIASGEVLTTATFTKSCDSADSSCKPAVMRDLVEGFVKKYFH